MFPNRISNYCVFKYIRIDLFSKVDIDVSKILREINLSNLAIPDLKQSSTNSSDTGAFEIRKASFQALPGKILNLDASVGIKGTGSISADIGSLQSSFSVNNTPLMKVSIRGVSTNFKSSSLDVDIGADILFEENDRTPAEVASIVHAATNNQSLGDSFQLNQFSIGYSDDDKVSHNLLIL